MNGPWPNVKGWKLQRRLSHGDRFLAEVLETGLPMETPTRRAWPSWMALVLSSFAGCVGDSSVSTASRWASPPWCRDTRDPVRIAITDSDTGVFDPASWAFISHRPPWGPLAHELSVHLQRPVQFSQLKPFQIAHHLQNGMCQFALVSGDTMELLRRHLVDVQPMACARVQRRQGVIVSSRRSGIRSLGDLKGKRFAFGPRRDPVLHLGTLATLAGAGIMPSDIKQELALTGFDGTLQHHRNSRDAARTIVYGLGNFLESVATNAGVLEAAVYDAFPETGGRWAPLSCTFSKDQFVELARTEPVEAQTLDGALFVASLKTDPAVVTRLRKLLLSMDRKSPTAVHALGFSRFDGDFETAPAESAPAKPAPAPPGLSS